MIGTDVKKNVRIEREKFDLKANWKLETLEIGYKELTFIEDVLVKEEIRYYSRDFAFWKESQLGMAIEGMIDLDLQQEDPSEPRNTTENE